MVTTPILQFGTSRFLQAHADLFISEALERGAAAGPITVVQSSGDAGRAKRLSALADPDGFPVQIRGLEAGSPTDRIQRVTSVRRCLSTTRDWPEIRRIAATEAGFILSNTGDRGFAPRPADQAPEFHQDMSYPAKLLHLLRARYRAGSRGLQVMPMELIAENGAVLKARVLELAGGGNPGLRDYLETEVLWVNSLVDRIVSAPLDPAGAVAEPYGLWAIEAQRGLVRPCDHPCVQVVRDLEQIEALKLYILNLGHTWMADRHLRLGGPGLVREVMADPAARAALEALYQTEVLPGFAAAGMRGAAADYVAVTLDRFANPFLDHKLTDIAQNHAQKITRRVQAFLDWAAGQGDSTPKPQLQALVARRLATEEVEG